ncbi:MAG: RloB family protein [Prevotella sp.]|jgi:hypothetical protein
MAKKSIAIIGEGETEWFYFESMRILKRYSYQLKPTFPKHSDWRYIFEQARQCVSDGYDKVFCLIDMDVMHSKPNEMKSYQKEKKMIQNEKIVVFETNPCTEFWFLLHFLPTLSTKNYRNCDEVVLDLRKYLPGYEKSKKYFKRTNLYQHLTFHGDLHKAIQFADKLYKIAQDTPEDIHSYTQIHKILIELDSLESNRK